MNPVTVLVLHRDRLVAEAIAAALDRFPGIAVVGCATSWTGDRPWGIGAAVVDPELPGARVAVSSLGSSGARVVSLGPLPGADLVGADRPVRELAAAIAPVARRRRQTLSPRERQVVELAGRGLAGKQVAAAMGISPKTVEQHKTRAFAKLGVPNQAAAVSALKELEGGGWWSRSAI
jgi:DNA-binding CsgD family transcriptional regulator